MESSDTLIPFADLKRQYAALKEPMNRAIQEVLDNTAFIGGRGNNYVSQFESEFSNWMGMSHTIGVANGTDALEIILSAWGIGPGDEVIVPALTWFSTVEAVLTLGAKPVFTDVIPGLNTMETSSLKGLITPRTKAIIPVHLYGQMARIDEIMTLAEEHGIKVLEDCAQAHGAERFGRKAGTYGHAAAFSFYPGKNLGAYGDAGGIVTNDEELAEICRQIANHGQRKKHDHVRNGRNSRLDGIQAAVLSIKLPFLEEWNNSRRHIATQYQRLITNSNISLPIEDTNNKHVYHLFVIHCEKREELANYLKAEGIETALHYPYPIPNLLPLKNMVDSDKRYPYTTAACNTLLSIPMFPELNESEWERVSKIINQFQ